MDGMARILTKLIPGLLFVSVPSMATSLYVSDVSFSTVQVFNMSGNLTGSLTPTGGWGSPAGIAVGPNGDVYVADMNNNAVEQFDPNGNFIKTFISTGLFEPTGLAFGPDGYLYVANFGVGNNSYISRFDSNGNAVDVTPFVPSSTGLFDPGAIEFGPDGNLYIADSSNAAIDKVLLPSGSFSTIVPTCAVTTSPSNPQGVAFGSDGNLYVSDAGSGCGNAGSAVYKYDTSGDALGPFIAPNVLSTPIDLVFGPDGNLYVTDAMGRVALFNGTTGNEMADFVASGGSSGPLVDPTFLAFGMSTPEPATFGFMALGVGVLAWLGRRSRV
jgi:tripartite motif-containing protein 71